MPHIISLLSLSDSWSDFCCRANAKLKRPSLNEAVCASEKDLTHLHQTTVRVNSLFQMGHGQMFLIVIHL